jgi:hypothetical protein
MITNKDSQQLSYSDMNRQFVIVEGIFNTRLQGHLSLAFAGIEKIRKVVVLAEENEKFEPANLVIYVTNQSAKINPIDIQVSLDGECCIFDTFDNTGRRVFQHNWSRYAFRYPPGSHVLTVRNERLQLELERKFTLEDQIYFVIDFVFPAPVTQTSRFFINESKSDFHFE